MKKRKGLTRDQVIDVIDRWQECPSFVCNEIIGLGYSSEEFCYIFDLSTGMSVRSLLNIDSSNGTWRDCCIKARKMRPLMLALYLAIVEDGGLK